MRWLHLSGGTGRSRGNRDARQIEGYHGGFGLEARNREQRGIRQPRCIRRKYQHARGPSQAAFKPISQEFEAGGVRLPRAHGCRCGRAEAGNSGDVLGARPVTPLLAAAAQQRLRSRKALGQNQRAGAFGAADLVRRKGHQIGIYHTDIKRYFSECLDRVDVQQAARGMDQFRRFRCRLHRAGFVVGQHHRYQCRRPAFEDFAQLIQIDQTGPGHASGADGQGRKPPGREHRGVLDRGDD